VEAARAEVLGLLVDAACKLHNLINRVLKRDRTVLL
jgi:hypothetical protein